MTKWWMCEDVKPEDLEQALNAYESGWSIYSIIPGIREVKPPGAFGSYILREDMIKIIAFKNVED